MKRVVLKLILNGGLGNQLFEHAAGYAIAKDLGLPFAVMWEPNGYREYDLDRLLGIESLPYSYGDPVCPTFGQGNAEIRRRITGAVANAPEDGDVYIRSPFQCEECFTGYEKEIRELYRLEPLPLPPHEGTPVAVQVRRGDYVKHRTLDVCTPGYFTRAMEHLRATLQEPHFFIFSDDPEWCAANLGGSDVTIMPDQCAIDGLRSMVGCKAHIISNSTFGWWGAWLSGSDTVVTPDPWHQPHGRYGEWDPVPERWIRLKVDDSPPTVVIPLHSNGGKFGENLELRYVLRSLEQHLLGPFNLVLAGQRMPTWIKPGTYRHIAGATLKQALRNAAAKYPKGFFWTYDDTILLRDHTPDELMVTPARREWKRTSTGWGRELEKVRHRLRREKRVVRDYSRPHGPYWFNKPMVDQGFKDWPNMPNKFPIETWILSRFDWRHRFDTTVHVNGGFQPPPEDAAILNFTDGGCTPELLNWLDQRFPVPSQYETVVFHGQSSDETLLSHATA
jgi:hypothetical protein